MHKAPHGLFVWLNFVGSFEEGKWSKRDDKNENNLFATDTRVTIKNERGTTNRPREREVAVYKTKQLENATYNGKVV
jgi:hypothetical protein